MLNKNNNTMKNKIKTTVKIADDTLNVYTGTCYLYGCDREGSIFETSEITHDEYKESVFDENYTQQHSDISDNVVLHYNENGGVFFVKSKHSIEGWQ